MDERSDLNLVHLDAPQPPSRSGETLRQEVRRAGRRLRRRRQVAIASPVIAAIVAVAIAVPLAFAGSTGTAGIHQVEPAAPTSTVPAPASSAPSLSASATGTVPAAAAPSVLVPGSEATLGVSSALLSAMPVVDQNADGDTAPQAGDTLRYAVHGLSTDGAPSRFEVWSSLAYTGHSVVQLRAAASGTVLWSASYDVDALPLFGTSAGLAAVSLADRADHVFARFSIGADGGQLVSFDVHSAAVGLLGTGPVGASTGRFVNAIGTVGEDLDHDGIDELADYQWNPAAGGNRAADSLSGLGMSVEYYRFTNGGWARFDPSVRAAALYEGAGPDILDQRFITPDGSSVSPDATDGNGDGTGNLVWIVTAGPHGFLADIAEFPGTVDGRDGHCRAHGSWSGTVIAPGDSAELAVVCDIQSAPSRTLTMTYAPYGTPLARWTGR